MVLYVSILIAKVTNANTIFVTITEVLLTPWYYFIVTRINANFHSVLEDVFTFIYEGLYSTTLEIVLWELFSFFAICYFARNIIRLNKVSCKNILEALKVKQVRVIKWLNWSTFNVWHENTEKTKKNYMVSKVKC